MDLPSFFRRKAPAVPGARSARPEDAAGGPEVRLRARRRLIGAVVLLGIGVIAFPLLFETEPRPIPVDLPIVVPSPDRVPPLAVPAPARRAAVPAAETPPAAAASAPAAPAAEAARPALPEPAAPPVPPQTEAKPEAKTADDGARAQALLEGQAAAAGRFVVQVGAFAEERAVRDVRARVEKIGLKTYTQVVKVQAGERTRVRIGPFATRDEADAAAAKLKKAGLPASVLTL